MRSGIGDRPKRREDLRFLTGQGRYLDDLAFDGVTYAVVLRAPHAHAEIRAIDTAAAKRMPGVLAVLTAADAQGDGLKPLLPYVDANTVTGEPFAFIPQPLLAEAKVRYVGEPVALIVAGTRDQALDAAERIAVDYAPLPAVTTGAAARMPGAPLLSSEVPGNLCFKWNAGGAAAVERGFAAATHVVSLAIDNHRVVTNPMEPRGVVGEHDPATGRYTAHVSAQSLHATRDHAARALGIEPVQLRFVAPDVGGGFGAKNFHLSRAGADPVGGEAGRPSGEVDRWARRSFCRRSSGPRPSG
jgi:carbon-monoxide dehydrogenase large subunit